MAQALETVTVTSWCDECTVHVTDSDEPVTQVCSSCSRESDDVDDTVMKDRAAMVMADEETCSACGHDHSYEPEPALAGAGLRLPAAQY